MITTLFKKNMIITTTQTSFCKTVII
uniref:Uncharacterized protein n=1 Tax=Arundo donax TaxID=35708 RepID=A0A0A8ZAS1_ARUDO